jgi:hypothetical protein
MDVSSASKITLVRAVGVMLIASCFAVMSAAREPKHHLISHSVEMITFCGAARTHVQLGNDTTKELSWTFSQTLASTPSLEEQREYLVQIGFIPAAHRHTNEIVATFFEFVGAKAENRCVRLFWKTSQPLEAVYVVQRMEKNKDEGMVAYNSRIGDVNRNGDTLFVIDTHVASGKEYIYEIVALKDSDGNDTIAVTRETIKIPHWSALLQQNYPNPFNPNTRIRYYIPHKAQASMDIYDILGRHVKSLVDGIVQPGWHQAVWDGRDKAGIPVASGIYFYVLRCNGTRLVRKCVLLR